MTKKRLGRIAICLLLVLLAAGGYVLWAVNQVPDFYREAISAEIDPGLREAEAKRFTQRSLQLIDDAKRGRNWTHVFTQRQVNSWFVEELNGRFADLLPPDARDPRVRITDDAVLIGFRYSTAGWDGVVSLQVKPWVPQENRLALQIGSIKAGSLPIPLDTVLRQIQRNFETRGWRVEWRQNDGQEVLLVDFSSDRKRSVLKSVNIADGRLRITGKRPERKRGRAGK